MLHLFFEVVGIAYVGSIALAYVLRWRDRAYPKSGTVDGKGDR